MNIDYWKRKWEIGDIGFHQAEVEPNLIKYFSSLSPGTVFVPLCGKTKDMKWLLDQGWKVIGVEQSTLACKAFFEESELAHQEQVNGSFTLFTCPGLTIWCGDFFELPESAVEGLTALYDRAALIALPPELRSKYAEKIKELVGGQKIEGLILALEYPQNATKGPPFSVDSDEVHRLFGKVFIVEEVERESDTVLPTKNTKFSDLQVTETTYILKVRA